VHFILKLDDSLFELKFELEKFIESEAVNGYEYFFGMQTCGFITF